MPYIIIYSQHRLFITGPVLVDSAANSGLFWSLFLNFFHPISVGHPAERLRGATLCCSPLRPSTSLAATPWTFVAEYFIKASAITAPVGELCSMWCWLLLHIPASLHNTQRRERTGRERKRETTRGFILGFFVSMKNQHEDRNVTDTCDVRKLRALTHSNLSGEEVFW